MKRFTAILLTGILLFNFYGYRLIIDYIQDRESVQLETRLDRDEYNNEDLISIKTPLNLPYYQSSADYERAYGSIEVKGITYEYVKRRVQNDTLELLCLPNKTKMQLQSAKNELLRLSVDASSTQQHKKPVSFKIAFPDFCQDINAYSFATLAHTGLSYFLSNTTLSASDYSKISDQPPELMHVS